MPASTRRFGMRIAINTIVTPADNKIGVGIYVDNLIKNLVEQFPEHLFYALVNDEEPAVQYQAKNFETLKFRAKPQPSPLLTVWQPAFARRLREDSVDVYHLPNTAPLLFNVCPTVVSILDLQEFRISKYGLGRAAYRRLANWLASRVADLILTISNNSKRDIVNLLGINPDKIRVTYLAHADSFRRLEKAQAVAYVAGRFGFRDYLITVGDIQPGKNLVRWIEAYARLRAKNASHRLVLVGKERRPYGELHAAIRRLNLEDSVTFTGYVTQEDLVHLYNAATLCVYPSLYEGFGLPVLESMACGVPIVTSNVSSIPEVAGDAAVLINPYEVDDLVAKTANGLSNPDQRSSMISAGLKQARKFSWRRTATETMAAYEYVMDERRKWNA